MSIFATELRYKQLHFRQKHLSCSCLIMCKKLNMWLKTKAAANLKGHWHHKVLSHQKEQELVVLGVFCVGLKCSCGQLLLSFLVNIRPMM